MLHHFRKHPIFNKQLVWRPNFNNAPPIHDNNLIIVRNCVESMSYCNDCCPGKFCLDAALDEMISDHVYIRSCLV